MKKKSVATGNTKLTTNWMLKCYLACNRPLRDKDKPFKASLSILHVCIIITSPFLLTVRTKSENLTLKSCKLRI